MRFIADIIIIVAVSLLIILALYALAGYPPRTYESALIGFIVGLVVAEWRIRHD